MIKSFLKFLFNEKVSNKIIYTLISISDIFFLRRSNSNLKDLKNIFSNKRCFLILSGASLNEIDLKKLKNEHTIAVNLSGLHKDSKEFFSMYLMPCTIYELNNHKGIKKESERKIFRENLDQDYLKSILKFFKSKKTGYHFYDLIKKSTSNESLIFLKDTFLNRIIIKLKFKWKDRKVFFYKNSNSLIDFKDEINEMDIDISKRFPGSDYTNVNVLLILIYLGFKEIYLCGAGYTYNPIYMNHFYDNYVFNNKKSKIKNFEKANHVSKFHLENFNDGLLFKDFVTINDRIHGRYINDFKKDHAFVQNNLINDYANAKGVNIKNITPDGFESPVFEKISWNEVKNNLKIEK